MSTHEPTVGDDCRQIDLQLALISTILVLTADCQIFLLKSYLPDCHLQVRQDTCSVLDKNYTEILRCIFFSNKY